MKWGFYFSGEKKPPADGKVREQPAPPAIGLAVFQRKYEFSIFQALSAGAPFRMALRECQDTCEPEFDGAVIFSLEIKRRAVMRAYRDAGKPVIFLDKGYFNRGRGVDHMRYFRMAINSTQPAAYFRMDLPSDRLEDLGDTVRLRKPVHGRFIMIAGSSERYSRWHDLPAPDDYAREVLSQIRQHTARDVLYRPKPKIKNVGPIDGAQFNQNTPLKHSLPFLHALVTHGSGAAVDAVQAGVPVFALGDHADRQLGNVSLAQIENPRMNTEDERRAWLAGMAYQQWDVDEMRTDRFWNYVANTLHGLGHRI